MRTLSKRSILVSAIVWGIGGWLYGRYETNKTFSWLIGMPFYLATSVIIWGTITGAVRMQKRGAIGGAVNGTGFGAMVGVLGFFLFMGIGNKTNVPPWLTVELIWAFAGVMAGGVAGATAYAIMALATAEM